MRIPEEHLVTYRVQKAAVFWGIIESSIALAVAVAAIFWLMRFVQWTLHARP